MLQNKGQAYQSYQYVQISLIHLLSKKIFLSTNKQHKRQPIGKGIWKGLVK